MPGVRGSVTPRERRTIAAGAAVSAAALLLAFIVLPMAREWREREALIGAQRDRLARLRALVAHSAELELAERAARTAASRLPQRLLAARTGALAASSLQTALQEYADRAQLQVSRLDVAGEADVTPGAPALPATLVALGDIHGLADLLAIVQHGDRVLEVTSLNVRANPSLRAPQELLEITLSVRAPYRVE